MSKKIQYALLLAVSLFAVSANAEPMAYSVNSDSVDGDSLYLIDLATGADQLRGELFTGIELRTDTEGLAFAPDGTLWGIDDNSRTMFPINKASGAISYLEEISFPSFPSGGGNDFGMTFSCDNSIYVSSVAIDTPYKDTLYKLDLEGNSQMIGSAGALGVNISAIAAIGNPTRLYGLGNGLLENGEKDSPNLYSIDVNTGIATRIGPLGAEAGDYNEAGLSFDSSGDLWAITDRNLLDGQPSQILSIDKLSGTATWINDTSEVGFESLAIAPPAECSAKADDDPLVERIPSLNLVGRLFAIFILMFAGMAILRKRAS